MKKNVLLLLVIVLFVASLLLSTVAYGQSEDGKLHLIRDDNSLAIYNPADEPVSLMGLELRTVATSNFPIEDFGALQLSGGVAEANTCYIYVLNGTNPPVPGQCLQTTPFKKSVPPADAFWRDFIAVQPRDIAIWRDGVSTGQICAGNIPDCIFTWPPDDSTDTPVVAPPLIPIASPTPTMWGCTGEPLLENNVFDLTLYRDSDSLVLYLDDQQPAADLSRLGFEFSSSGERDYLCLHDLPSLTALVSRPLTTPVCLRLAKSGSTSPLPIACNGVSPIEVILGDSDIFWYENEALAFLILNGDQQVDFCGTFTDCTVSVGAPPPPTAADVTLYLEWDADYLVAYVEDTGIINLDGLRITDDPGDPGNRLQQRTAFAGLRFDEIHGPICFALATSGSQEAFSKSCPTNRQIVEYVSDANVFWYVNHNNRILYVLMGNTLIEDYCANSGHCERHIPQ